MIERIWSELLENSANKVPTSPAPVGDILTGVRLRRRRFAVKVAAAAVLVSGAGVASWALGVFEEAGNGRDQLTASEPEAVVAADSPPSGMRWAGIGPVAVAVPDSWGHNDTRCGVPVRDTVIVESDLQSLCQHDRPEGVDSVTLIEGSTPPWLGDRAPEEVTLNGEKALRWKTVCSQGGSDQGQVCWGAVRIAASAVSVIADSSRAAAAVDEVLERVHVLDAGVGVPDYGRWSADMQERSGEEFARHLRTYGFAVEVVGEKRQGVPPGYLLDVLPRPSTVTHQGAKVTLTVAE